MHLYKIIIPVTLFVMTVSGCSSVSVRSSATDMAPVSKATMSIPQAERPSYKLTDTWMRTDGVYTLTEIDRAGMYVFTGPRGEKVWLTEDLFVARVERWGYFMEFHPPSKIAWPLTVGSWGVFGLIWNHSWTNYTQPVDWLWRVEAYEEIYTPLHGKTKAFKIVHEMTILPWRTVSKTFIAWYSSETERIVRIEGDPWFGFISFR